MDFKTYLSPQTLNIDIFLQFVTGIGTEFGTDAGSGFEIFSYPSRSGSGIIYFGSGTLGKGRSEACSK